MLRKRIIPCLDVRDGRVVKGVQFRNHQDAGDIVELAQRYCDQGADELVFYDISASSDGRVVDKSWVRQVASVINVPFCVAGGIRTVEQAKHILLEGADKISINSPALERPTFITELAEAFGVQCVVVGVDSRREDGDFQVYQYTGDEAKTIAAKHDTRSWVQTAVEHGAGEIVLNCMDQDGVKAGYDLDQLQQIRAAVRVPVIASGGAGALSHFKDVFHEARVDGALAASVFHRGDIAIPELKNYLHDAGIPVRLV